MAAIQEQDFQKLLDQVEALRKKIESVGEEGRSVLSAVGPGLREIQDKLAITAGKIGTGAWDHLPEDQKTALHQQLFSIHKVLECAAEDTPTDPDSIMYNKHAPNWVIWLIMIGAIILTVADLREIFLRWEKATKIVSQEVQKDEKQKEKQTNPDASQQTPTTSNPTASSPTSSGGVSPGTSPVSTTAGALSGMPSTPSPTAKCPEKCPEVCCPATELDVLVMVVLFGALGGLLRLIISFAAYVGNRQLRQSWIIYYIFLPLLGAGLAPVMYLLLRVGILSAPVSPVNASSAAVNLNVFGVYAIAGVTGMFSVQAMEMLKGVFEVIFKKFEAKDSLALNKDKKDGPSQSSGTTGGSKPS